MPVAPLQWIARSIRLSRALLSFSGVFIEFIV